MTVSTKRSALVASRCAMAVLALGSTASAAPVAARGPSSSDRPYLVHQVPGVTLTSILTAVVRIAQHDSDRFLPGGAVFDTIDEESSGVVPVPFLGQGKYLIDVQNHKAVPQPDVSRRGSSS